MRDKSASFTSISRQQKAWVGSDGAQLYERVVNRRWVAVLNLIRRDLVGPEEVAMRKNGVSSYERTKCFGVDRVAAEMEYRYVSSR